MDGLFLPILLLALLSVSTWLYLRFLYVDFACIKGIPEIPGGSLLHGHLYLLGKDHATTAQTWAEQYGWPVFQVRLGFRRVVFLNGFEAARTWLVKHQAATIDRPKFYTFHGVVSKTSAATIGSNPWNERTKKQRLVVGSLTTAPAIRRLAGMMDCETAHMVSSLFADSKDGKTAITPHLYQKRLALNIVLMFCYGRRFGDLDDPLLLGILRDASIISTFRSTNANAQDYVPYLRYLPGFLRDRKRVALATEVRARRDLWLAKLLQEVRDKIDVGEEAACVAAGLITNRNERLSEYDIRTILGGLMSGGFETVYTTAIAGIMYLSSSEGQSAQQKAYEDVMKRYKSPEEAFENAVLEEKSSYVVAFVREVLRYYPPIHILPPRQTFQDFECGDGVQVPKGVMVLVNCQAVNHDPTTYGPDAHIFRPERWTDKEVTPSYNVPPPYEFAFGAGSRMCTAVNFSNRILYSIFLRLIVSFLIRAASDEDSPNLHFVDYNRDATANSACPKDFKAVFEPRDREVMKSCLLRSEENASR